MIRRSSSVVVAVLLSAAGILAFGLLIGDPEAVASSPTAPAPVVSSIVPSSAYFDVETPVTITGEGFAAEISGTAVLTSPKAYLGVNPLLDVTWLNTTTITGVVPAYLPTGVYSVFVTNPDGQEGALTDAFTLAWEVITPTLTSITPAQAPNDSQIWATVAGSDFVAWFQGAAVITQPTVTLGPTPLAITFVNADQLDVRIPAGTAPGVYTLTVTNPGGGWARLTRAYTATLPPEITEIAPTVSSNDLDTSLAITGANFQVGHGSPQIYVGETLVGIAEGTSDLLTATVPWGLEAGVHAVAVVNGDGGRSTLPDALTVTHAMNSWETGGPYGGRAVAMVQHPADDDVVYAQIWDAGVFATHDGAESWSLLLQEELRYGLVMDAGNPDVLYAGHEGGVYRTLDGGATWAYVKVYSPPMNCFINRPAAHPTLPGTVYVAVRSCGGEFSAAPGEGGVYYSSDYGATWARRTGDLTNTKTTVVAIDPAAPNTLLAGSMDGEIFASVDNGAHWQWLANLADEIRQLAFDPYGTSEAWAIVSPDNGLASASLFKNTGSEFGAWSPVTVAEGVRADGIGFAPGKVWVAGGSVYWSDDGGASWTDTYGPSWGQSVVLPSTLDPQLVYANGGYGVFRLDAGGDWEVKKQGLAGIIPLSVASPRTEPDLAYAKTHELGLLTSTDGGHTWQDHDGFWSGGAPWPHSLAVDPITNTRLYLAYSAPASTPYVAIGEPVGGVWQETLRYLPLPPSASCGTGTAMAVHPTRPGHLMAGATYKPCGVPVDAEPGALFATADNGDYWQAPQLPDVISEVTSIAYTFWDPDLVFAGTRGTGLLRSKDGGASWEMLTGYPGEPYITTVAPHPNDAGTVYVLAETQNSGGGIYVSYDRGDTWERLTEEVGVDVVISPPNPGARLYSLLTSCGAFVKAVCRSVDGGRTWYAISGSPRPTALGASSDGERNAVYIGSNGGLAAPVLMGLNADSLQTAGVYRFVTVPLIEGVYLPLVLR